MVTLEEVFSYEKKTMEWMVKMKALGIYWELFPLEAKDVLLEFLMFTPGCLSMLTGSRDRLANRSE